MAHDEGLAERVRETLAGRRDITEMHMFGGIAFLVRGNMTVGVVRDDLMVRVGAGAYEAVVSLPHARPMDFTGRPMKGFVYVAPEGVETDADLREWIERGLEFALTLPERIR